MNLLVGSDVYRLAIQIKDGKISWWHLGRNGVISLHEGEGRRVLHFVTNGSIATDFVFDP